MYFLKAAFAGMKRRWLATTLVAFGGVSLLCASAGIGLWSYWLSQSSHNTTTQRTAAAFLGTVDDAAVLQVVEQMRKIPGVEEARAVTTEEFSAYLKDHFPTLSDLVSGLGTEVIPRFVEVRLPQGMSSTNRAEILADLQSVPQVLRVDDGSSRVEKALNSFHWLSVSGMSLAMGLWAVLFIVCLGHYQSAFQAQQSEMQLLRSFGATQLSLLLPWILEALLQSVLTAVLSVALLLTVRSQALSAYNDFFGTIGFEPLHWDTGILPLAFLGSFLAALAAHTLGGSFAFLRSKAA